MAHHFRAVVLSICIAGVTMGLSCEYASAGFAGPPLAVGSNSASASSWVGGGHVGYNWQNGAWVYGLEGDISGMHLKTDFNTMLSTGAAANTNSTVDWYGTVRGRLGWASGPVFFYGTGGVAFGGVDLNSTISSGLGPPRSLTSQTSDTKGGWVAGAGLDWLWRPDVIVKLAYQYVDLGSISVAGTNTAFSGVLSQNATANARFSVVTLGLSWRFAPGSGGPWEGFYAGGQVGGAWGNHTEASYLDQVPVPASDRRLKRDVVLIGQLDDGLGLYRYRYLWSDTVYVGVMGQEVALIHPDAIVRSTLDDYLRVDYSRLGLRLMTLSEWDARRAGKGL